MMKRLLTSNKIIHIIIFLLAFTFAKGQTLQCRLQSNFSNTDIVTIPVILDSVTPIGSITFGMDFDTAQLECISVTQNANIGGFFTSNIQNGRVIVAWFSLTPITQTGTFLNLTFLRKNAVCTAPVTWANLSNQLITDQLGNPIPAQLIDGEVHFLKEESPNLVYPPSEATNIPVSNLFRWNGYDLSCVAQYHYQLAIDSNFTQIVTDTLLNDTTFAVVAMQESTPYYWRVAKIGTISDTYWSDTLRFFTESLDTTHLSMPSFYENNDTLLLPLLIQNEESISQFSIRLQYDTTQLSFVTALPQSALPVSTIISNTIFQNIGKINFDWQTTNYPVIIPSDTLAMLVFTKKNTCEAVVTFDTTATSNEFYFYQNITLPTTFTDATVIFVDTLATQLQMPADGSTAVFIRPNLQWDSIGCTNNYRLQLFDGNQVLLLDTLLNNLNFVPKFLEGDSTYLWRVGRYNVLDSLFWSDTWSFHTEEVLDVTMTAFDVLTFADTFSVVLALDSLRDAIAFELQLEYDATAMTFLSSSDTTAFLDTLNIQHIGNRIIINWEAMDSTAGSLANILSDTLIQLQFVRLNGCQTVLHWDIDSSDFYHLNDNINIDATFQDANLTFLNENAPTTLLPIGGDTLRYPDLVWQTAASCATQYRLEIASDAQFTQVSIDTLLSDTTFWATTLEAETQYYWRVAKEDIVGNLYWSDTLDFFTGSDYVTRISADSILTYQDTAITTIILDSAFYVTGFHLEINHIINGLTFLGLQNTLFSNIQTMTLGSVGTLLIDWQDTSQTHFITGDTLLQIQWLKSTTCQSPVILNVGHTQIFYRENALSDSLNLVNGRVEFLNTDAPFQIFPAANAVDIDTMVNYTWQSVDCSANYRLRVATDTNFVTVVLDSADLNTTSLLLQMSSYTKYFWQVGRYDTQGDLYWSDTLAFTTQFTTATKEQHLTNQNLLVYPNPVQDELTISNGIGMITIYNALGQSIRQIRNNETLTTVDTSDLPKGIYVLHIQKTNGQTQTVQFVK